MARLAGSRSGRLRGALAVLLVLALVNSLLFTPARWLDTPAAAAAADPGTDTDASVPVSPVAAKRVAKPTVPPMLADPPVWPGSASAVVSLPADASGTRAAESATVGGLPVKIAPVEATSDVLTQRSVATAGVPVGPGRVQLDVITGSVSQRLGSPVALRLTRIDGGGPGSVQVAVSYSAFRHAYGGDYASRLRLVAVPPCALTSPQDAACQQRLDLGAVNDVRAG